MGIALVGFGCAHSGGRVSTATGQTGLVTATAFVKVAESSITEDKSPVQAMHLVGDGLFVYSSGPTGTRVTHFSRALNIRWARVVGGERDTLRAPIRIGERIIFPTLVSLEIYNSRGTLERSQRLPRPVTTEISASGSGMILAGVASETGGRVAFIDPTQVVGPVVSDVLLGEISSRPVEFEGTAYAATAAGKIFAIGANSTAVWPLKDGAFLTEGAISADLVVDDFALYAASTDSKLYVLDRASGKIKWRYFAQSPLTASPFVTADRVYQMVGKGTLVALDKIEGAPYRKPIWTLEGVTKVVASDASFVYVQSGTTVNAVDKKTGEIKFSTQRTDLASFATNPTDAVIYAVTSAGKLVAFRPVLTGAAVGELVLVPVSIDKI